MPSTDVGGVSLYYEEAGSGRAVVFVHGIPTDFRAWGAQVGPFSNGRRAIAISRRYASPNNRDGDVSDSTVENNARDLKGFVEKIVGGPADVVGHSYGGFISAVFAADHPELVRSLVLVEPAVSSMLVADPRSQGQLLKLLFTSPSVALSGRRFQTKSLEPSLKALETGRAEEAVELNVDGVQDTPGAFKGLPDQTKEMMLANARTIAELKTPFPKFTAREAGKIRAPTLVVNGEGSALFLRRIGHLLAKAVPQSTSVTVSGSKHFPHFENPVEFNSKVLGFLEKAPG